MIRCAKCGLEPMLNPWGGVAFPCVCGSNTFIYHGTLPSATNVSGLQWTVSEAPTVTHAPPAIRAPVSRITRAQADELDEWFQK